MKKSIPGFDPQVEGALSRFDLDFVVRAGPDSVLLKALSDLWTIQVLRIKEANSLCEPGSFPVLYSSDRAVDVLRSALATDKTLRVAMFQEPFGFAKPGTIEHAFAQVFGEGAYSQWRDALEHEQFDLCLALTKSSSSH